MSTELLIPEQGLMAQTVCDAELDKPQNRTLLEVIAAATTDSRVDVVKMQALLDMHERVAARQAEIEFNHAMAALQPKLPRIPKHGAITNKAGGVQSRYARYEDIDEAIRPLLSEHGFSVTYGIASNPDKIGVTCTVRHIGGHSVTNTVYLPTDSSGAKNGVQGVGSTISYGKRYLLCLAFNIVMEGEDTDADQARPATAEQVQQIRTLMAEAKADEAKFLAYLQVQRLEDLAETEVPKAINLLRNKIQQQKGGAK